MYPNLIQALQDRFDAGDREGAMEVQRAINRLCQESQSPVQFTKRWATERGYPVGLEARATGANPYMGAPDPLSDGEYERYKAILEEEIARFPVNQAALS